MEDFEKAFNDLKESIIRAAYKIEDDGKAEAYMRSKLDIIWHVGKEVGKQSLTNEIFNNA